MPQDVSIVFYLTPWLHEGDAGELVPQSSSLKTVTFFCSFKQDSSGYKQTSYYAIFFATILSLFYKAVQKLVFLDYRVSTVNIKRHNEQLLNILEILLKKPLYRFAVILLIVEFPVRKILNTLNNFG